MPNLPYQLLPPIALSRTATADGTVNRLTRLSRTTRMESSYKIDLHSCLCILFTAAVLLISGRAGAQPLSAGQTASPSISRLVGTVEGAPFSGAVFDDGSGIQSFYPLYGQLPDGSHLLKVRSKSIVVKKTDGALYEIFTTSGAYSAVTALPSPSVSPSEPRETVTNFGTKSQRPRGRAGRTAVPETDE